MIEGKSEYVQIDKVGGCGGLCTCRSEDRGSNGAGTDGLDKGPSSGGEINFQQVGRALRGLIMLVVHKCAP
jgi:hypothetical protein